MKETTKRNNAVGRALSLNSAGLVLAFALICVGLSFASEHFLTYDNIMTVLRQSVYVAILAFGMTFVIGMGGIDLSVGALMAAAGMMVGGMMTNGVNIYLAILFTLLGGFLTGSLTGSIIAFVRIPDFIVTMAMMSIVRGGVSVYSEGKPIYGLNYPEFTFMTQGRIGPAPVLILIAAVAFAIFFYVLNKTGFGRYAVSIGSNAESARLAGIPVAKMKVLVYGMCGMLAAFSGILMTSRLTSAVPDAGSGYEMDAIAAVVIGGTSLSGGKASMTGAAIGAVLMALVRNGLNILNVVTFWHQVVIGGIVLVAVGLDVLSNRYSASK
jgi:ribose transport system permease protein